MITDATIWRCRKCGGTERYCSKAGKTKCRNCTLLYSREWYSRNREKVDALSREWRSRNREKVAATKRKSRSRNREKAAATRREWQSRNREKVNASTREWQSRNREKMRLYGAIYKPITRRDRNFLQTLQSIQTAHKRITERKTA